MVNKNILLAEDEPTILRLVRTYFERDGYTVFAATNGEIYKYLGTQTYELYDLIYKKIKK